MFVDKWKPLFQIPEDTGSDTPQIDDQGTPPPQEPEEGKLSGRSSLRKSLEKGFEDGRKAEADEKKGKTAKQPKRIAGGATVEPEEPEVEEGETPEEGAETTPQVAAPEAFSKEAKAEWPKTPKTIQEAVLKREADMAKGVEELKGKYKDIDTALGPHMNAIRQHGHTPAQAVAQLFGWFQALAGNPDVAFPALAKSFGYDLAKAVAPAAPAVPAQPDPAAAAAAQPTASPELQKYIDDMKKELAAMREQVGKEIGEVKTTFQRETEAKTNDILMNWSKDKPHFEAVRGLMAQFIQSGAVPLKNGQVDLDGAYEQAIWAHPETRAKILAEQQAAQAAERKKKAEDAAKKRQEEADKARKAGVSLGGGAPGEPGTTNSGKRGKGKSVRESIMEAREQLTE